MRKAERWGKGKQNDKKKTDREKEGVKYDYDKQKVSENTTFIKKI